MTVEPPPADQERLEQMGLYKIAPYLGAYYYVFNVQKKPLTTSASARPLPCPSSARD